MTISLFKRKSAVAQMLSVLKKFGSDAHLYLPGVGVISGITAGNYLDSVGTTVASVDGLVGLVLDAAGSVGAELVTTPSIAAVGIGGPAFTNYPTGASVVSGKTYKISYTISGYSGSGNVGFSGIVFNSHSAATANGTYVNTMTATGTGAVEMFSRSTNTCQFSGITVKEITGIHASQATTGNKPTLRRGLVNLLTYSNDLSNAAWLKTNATVGVAVADPDGGMNARNVSFVYGAGPITRLYQDYGTAVNGAKYTFPIWLRSDTPCQMILGVQRSGPTDVEQTVIDITATWQMFVFSHSGVFTGSSAVRGVLSSAVPGFSANVDVYRPGLFQGTLTATEILAAGGIPLTTTAPASSSVGAYAWEFGGDDALVLNHVPFTLSDDHCVIAAGRANDSADFRTFFSNSGTDSTRVCQVYIANATGYPTVLWRDSANSANGSCVDTVNRVGQFIVISGRKVGNQLECAVNGAVKESKTAVFGASAPVAASIGANTALGGYYYKGDLGGVITIKGTVTPADTLTLSRGLNALSGYAAGRF